MITFNSEDTSIPTFSKRICKAWISKVISDNGMQIGDIAYVFCSNKKILQVNRKYLNHHYLTDIITFNYNSELIVNSDIFICVNTVYENSKYYKVSYIEELYRVMIHGILHLVGFDDKTEKQQLEMTKKEDEALNLLYNQFLTN